ncbi:MAG: lysophospholipid acyltransferase family protein [Campylobacterota bacterium]|nr:lysophospholipid acyltransferase family protein [Campylobacterota bacterium]
MKKFKKKLLNYIQLNIVPYLLQLFVKVIYITSKKVYHHPLNFNKEQNFILSIWHGDLLMQPFNYHNFKKNGEIKAMISEHRDGETIRKIMKYFNIDSIYGSSTRGGVKAMVSAIKSLRNGYDIAITPDGPKGPIYSIADGIVAISKKTDTPIVVFSSIPQKYWVFNSWDKFIIPKPFSKIDFYVSEPFYLDDLSIEEAKKLIYNNMMKHQLKK